jgi:hypothetical protein
MKRTPWREIRAKLLKPADEPRLAHEREKIDAVLAAEQKRRHERPTDRP